MTTANITYDYGFDFGEQRKAAAKKEAKLNSPSAKKAALRRKDMRATVMAVLVAGLLLVSTIVVSAYTASLKYDNNELISANAELQDDIDVLSVKIQSATNLSNIERIAREKYGMSYADEGQYIYITNSDEPSEKFAIGIKKEVYN